ncbi:diguanylate cyclase [Ideonella sp.]|uniref:diguanylate cyclase n=1 Tax=Ideonella sp. TaxID=1929293 RepID=UPI0035AE047D
MKIVLLRSIAAALDGLDIGFCAFDSQDRAVAWNETFLAVFPEHRGHVQVGEPYADNLRRFYGVRLQGAELDLIERYIEQGIARHRSQRRPYEFEHLGQRLRVSSVEAGRFGRLRVWRRLGPVDGAPRATQPVEHPGEVAWRGILERIPDGVLVVDSGDHMVWANAAFLALYGLPADEPLTGRPFEALYRQAWDSAAESPRLRDSLQTLAENRRFPGAPFELALPGDRWVRVVEQRGDAADGTGCFVHVDITAAKRQQQALQAAQERARESEARYRLLAEYSSDVTLELHDGAVTYVSPAITRLLGWSPEQVLGRRVEDFCHPDDAARVAAAARSATARGESEYRVRALHAAGEPVWVEARSQRLPPRGAGDTTTRAILNVRGIAARKQVEDRLAAANRRLEALAVTDALTGLANRRRFDEALEAECRRAQRDGSELTLLICDLDDFKRVNDGFGHPVGDQVLQRVAELLTAHAQRAGDVAARYGGEEFAVLLPHTPHEHAAAVAEALRRAVEAETGWPPGVHGLTVSIGLAGTRHGGVDGSPRRLVLMADHALYAAKRQGKNRVVAATATPSPLPAPETAGPGR